MDLVIDKNLTEKKLPAKKRLVVEICLVTFILLAFSIYILQTDTFSLTAYTVLDETPLQNNAPVWIGKKANFTIAVNNSLTLNLNNYFKDIDKDELTFLAASSSEDINLLVDNELIKITPKSDFEGIVFITLIASDMESTIRQEISLSIQHGISPIEQIITNSQVEIDEELIKQFELGNIVKAIIIFDLNTPVENLTTTLVQEKLKTIKNSLIEQKDIDFGYHLADPSLYDIEIEKEYILINAIAVKLTKRGFNSLKEHPEINEILSDKTFTISSIPQNIQLINAPDVHNENITGKYTSACILDTGISPNVLFKSQILQGYDFVNNDPQPDDDHNHGTHIAGIIFQLAPATKLVPMKVCDNTGSCTAANILAGIDYCLENKNKLNITIISGSFGDGGSYSKETCPSFFDSALEIAEDSSIINLFASGNQGFKKGVNYPACSPYTISVGAVNNSDHLADFTNLPSDILAPGVDINSTIIEGYAEMTGTSMAVPHVAGTVTLLQSSLYHTNKSINLSQTKTILKETGTKIGNYSRINAYTALVKLLDNKIINEKENYIQKEQKAKIQFKQPVDLGQIRKCSKLGTNYVEIFSDKCPQYNLPAAITIWDVNLADSEITILKDNKPCPDTVCSNIILQNTTLMFDVANFSSYQVAGLDSEFGIQAGVPTPIGCEAITSAGNYTLITDPLDASSGHDCYVVTSDDVWFDCAGGTIFHHLVPPANHDPWRGFNVQNVSNFTLVNCKIRNFNIGVYLYNVTNSTISRFNTPALSNYIFNNTAAGVVLNISHNNSVTENAVYNNSRIGIHLYNSSNNTILNNFVYNHTIGVWLNNSHNNSLLDHEDNRFDGHNVISMLFIDSFDNLLGSTATPWSNFTTPIIFQNSTHGGINYSQGLNLSPTVDESTVNLFMSNYIRIKENFTRVDTANAPRLNKSATITLLNFALHNASIVVDFADSGNYANCSASVCTLLNITENVSAVFNVTSFTTYALKSNVSAPVPSTPSSAPIPQPSGSKGKGWPPPPLAKRKILRTALFPSAQFPPSPPPSPPQPQVQTPAVIGQEITQSHLQDTDISCGYILNTLEKRNLIFSETTLKEEIKNHLPKDYDLISQPLSLKCSGEDLDLSFNLPGDYDNVKALKCNKNGCTELAKEINPKELVCGGKTIEEIRTQELSKQDKEFWMPEPSLILEVGKVLTQGDQTITLGDAILKIKTWIKEPFKAVLETPKFNLPQPLNPTISILGSPIQLTIEETFEEPLKAKLIMPFIVPQGFDKESVAIYWLNQESKTWEYIIGIREEDTVEVLLNDLRKYIKDGKAIFAVQGIKCVNCLESAFEKIYNPHTRDAVVLVHGFSSSPLTWQFVIDDFVLNKQPFQIWTFGYPSTMNLETISNEFAKLLELNANQYDNLYFVGHSLGALVVQEALAQAFESKGKYSFLNKVKNVIAIGSPNEGSPAAEVYYNLFNHFLNKKSIIKLFSVDSVLVKQLAKGKIIPRTPTIAYDVVAGTAPYVFNLGFFTFTTQQAIKFISPNDGIITVQSAQHIGDSYINNSCKDFFSINVTHTDLIKNPTSRRVIEKIITNALETQKKNHNKGQDKTKETPLLGYNQYARLLVTDCQQGDVVVFVGKKLTKEETSDPLNCKCGNNVCGAGETVENCPQDCALFRRMTGFLKGKLQIMVYSIFLVIFSIALLLLSKKLCFIYKRKSIAKLKKELQDIKEHLR